MATHDTTHEPAAESYDQVDTTLVMVILVSAAIFFGGVVVPATMALNNYVERSMAATDVVAPPDADLTKHELAQLAKITRYRWVDQTKGVAAIPIDRAMQLYAERQVKKPQAEK